MLCAALSIDHGSCAPFRFARLPKLGDHIACSRAGRLTQAKITALRNEVEPSGSVRLLVEATTVRS